MSKIDDIISKVLQREGSTYTNDPNDSGGPTKYGITQAALARYRVHAVSAQDVAALNEAEARALYAKQFIEDPGFFAVLGVEQAIGEKLIDAGVNTSPMQATLFLQQALNALNRQGKDFADIAEDGGCGPKTVNALRAFLGKRGKDGETVLLRALNDLQGAFYIDLSRRRPKDEEFVFGWLLQRIS